MKYLLICQIKSYENIWHLGGPNRENIDNTIIQKQSAQPLYTETYDTVRFSVTQMEFGMADVGLHLTATII